MPTNTQFKLPTELPKGHAGFKQAEKYKNIFETEKARIEAGGKVFDSSMSGYSAMKKNIAYYGQGGAGYADSLRDYKLQVAGDYAKKHNLGISAHQLYTNPQLATDPDALAKYTGRPTDLTTFNQQMVAGTPQTGQAPVDISQYTAEWQEQAQQGLSVDWIQKNVNPQTGKLYSEEARATQVEGIVSRMPVEEANEALKSGRINQNDYNFLQGKISKEEYLKGVTTTTDDDLPLTTIQDEVLGDSKPAAVTSDPARLEEIKEEAEKQIEIEKETKDTEAEITQLTQQQQLQNLRTELGLDPDTGEKLERPGVPTYETSFDAFRSKEGIPALESRINTLDEQIRDTGASLREGLYDVEGKLKPMELIGTEQRELARQGQEAIDTLNREKQTLVDELTTKTTLVSNLMKFKQMDYETASADYTSKFNEKISLMNIIEGRETDEQNEQNRLRDDARANLSVMTDMMSDQGIIWDELGPNLQAQIANLEIKAGLPSGITQAFINEKPDAKVMAQTTSYDKDGNQIVSFIYEGADGKPSTVEVVQTGGVKSPTGMGDGGGNTIVDDGTPDGIDLSTPEGLDWAKEQGHNYEDVYAYLDQNTKWSPTVISDKLKRAGFQTVEQEAKAKERGYSNKEILDFAEMFINDGRTYDEFVAGLEGASDADKKEAERLWKIKEDELKAVSESESVLNRARRAVDKALGKAGPEEVEAADIEEGEKPQTRKGIEYTIQSGDTLSKIASKYGTTVEELAKINNIADPNKIYAGKTLKIPVPGGPIDI